MKLIFVDDHSLLLNALQEYLSQNTAHTIICCNSLSALWPYLGCTENKLVYLDIHLKGENGLRNVATILEKDPFCKVILMSAAASFFTVTQAKENGASGFIAKEDGLEAILQSIDVVRKDGFFLSATAQDFIKTNTGAGTTILSAREIEIVNQFAAGLSYKEVGAILGISSRTVETHRNNIIQKLGLKSMIEVVRYALKNNMID